VTFHARRRRIGRLPDRRTVNRVIAVLISISIGVVLLTSAPPVHAFARVGALTLEAMPDSAVIDAANGFAYFGTETYPGIVVKVRLSDFTSVGALALNPGEDVLSSAVIDTVNGFAYFGTCTQPGIVVKIRLSDLTRVGTLTLNTGEDTLRSAVIDTVGGFAYFGTDTFPGKAVKVRLSDFTRAGALTLESCYLRSAVIDTVDGFAYFASRFERIDKVRLSDFTRVGTLDINIDIDGSFISAVIDTANRFAYFGMDGSPGRIVKIKLSDFTHDGTVTLNTGEDYLASAVIDAANGFAYFGTYTKPGKVVKVRLSDFTRVEAVTLDTGENGVRSAVIDVGNGFAYFGTGMLYDIPYYMRRVVKVDLDGFDFSLSNSGGISVIQGGSCSNTITATLVSGTTRRVALSASVPSEIAFAVIVSFDPSSGDLTFTSTCTVTVSSSSPRGLYQITVVGVSASGVTRSTSFTLNIIEKGTTRIVLDASPKPGYSNKPVTIFGTLLGSWRCIRDGMVIYKPVTIAAGWGFSTIATTDYYGQFSVTTNCPPTGGTYAVRATFYEDQDLRSSSTSILYEVIAKIPTSITISYIANREFAGYLTRTDTGAYLAYRPVKLTVTYLSGTTWRTDTFDLQTRHDGFWQLEFLFYWRTATIVFEGDETCAPSTATVSRSSSGSSGEGSVAPPTANPVGVDNYALATFRANSAIGSCRFVLDASPKPGYAYQSMTIFGTLLGSWRCIRDGMVVGKPVEIKTGWGFSTVLTTDYYGQFSVTTNCPAQGGTYPITATFYEDQDLTGSSTTISYEVIAKIPTTITISYVGNREFGGYLRRADTGAYLAYKPVKLTVHYLSGTSWQTATYDLQTRQDGYYSLEFLFYWNQATISFEGDETYAPSSATITR